MKTLLSIILVVLSFMLIPGNSDAQCPDNFYPNNQAELDAFLTNYPNCTNFPGDIRLDEADIDDLTPLQNLTSIGGYLVIRFTQLTSLEGLENLTSVGEIFSIYDNDQLPDLDELSNLSSVGHLDIQHNDLLTVANLSGLHSTGGIFIGNNPLLSTINLSSLNSVPENVHITSNNQLTSLQGLNNLSTIGGYLHISGNQALTSLNLNSLSSIGQYLIISTNPKITSLQGLGNLTSLGGGFQVTSNIMLTSLEGLGTFTSIGGALQIINNDLLTSLQALGNINSMQGDLQIDDNALLSSLQGLENIDIENITHLYLAQNPILTVCDLPNICNYLSFDILDNPRTIFGNATGCESVMAVQESCMPDLPDCPVNVVLNTQAQVNEFGQMYGHCTEITGDLTIQGADITDLSPLANITSIGSILHIRDNPNLNNLNGLGNITSIGSFLDIRRNPSLINLNGLGNLTSIGGSMIITINPNLNTFDGLGNLTSIDGSMIITDNPSLTSLAGLGNLMSVGGQINISNNDMLGSLSGLNNLTAVRSDLYIRENNQLTSLDGLENITSVGSFFLLTNNGALSSLAGLKSLMTIGQSLAINGNPMLESFNGLQNLKSIGLHFSITGNNNLTSIREMQNLTSLGGALLIRNSPQLESMAGLENIDPTTITELFIYGNTLLSICDLPNICTYLATNKPRSIYDNATGCATEMEVLESCMPEEVFAVSVEALENITVECSKPPHTLTLPDSVVVHYSNNTSGNVDVTWDRSPYDGTVGSHSLTGTLDLTAVENPDNLMASITVIVEDSHGPVPDDETLPDISAQCEVTENDVTPPTATDACSPGTIIATTDFAFPTAEDGTITWTFEDDAGNTSTLTQNIVIQDSEAPVPDNESLDDITAQCEVTAKDVTPPTATDNCTQANITATTDFAFPTAADGTITWTFEDDAGNTSTQTQNIVIESSALPEIECPESHIVSCDSVVTFDLPTVSSECGPVSLIQTDGSGLTTGSVFPIGTTTLSYKSSNSSGSVTCKIEIEVLPPLNIKHISGVANGDTLHLADCLPPLISKENLDLGPHQQSASLISHIYRQDLPGNPEFGLWKISLYTYEVEAQCGNTEYFEHYVALYDFEPPVFRNFPLDTTISTPSDLPRMPDDVRIIDICRYVVWDTVTTTPILDPDTYDTLAFIRRWMAEDEVGNKSFRDQLIQVRSTPEPDLNVITAHIVKEEDLIEARFPFHAGSDSIPVTLYKHDNMIGSFAPIDTLPSGNWMGSRGNLFFTSLLPGDYRLQVHLPPGYKAIHPDSIVYENGWSDTLTLVGDSTLSLGTVLLVPGIVSDTFAIFSGIEKPYSDVTSRNSGFTIYPNPTTGRIRIGMPGGENFDFTIFNHLGQTVLKGMAENGSEIDLSGQVNGMYFLIIENKEKFIGTKRILLLQGR